MDMWDLWKKSFDAWEGATAKYLEHWLRSPIVLEPAGAVMTAAMKSQAAAQKVREGVWASMGFATRTDQERTLHALNQLQSRLMDLEEDLREARGNRA